MSSELSQTIDKLLSSGVVNRHSYFQLKYFVIGKEPTVQSKMWRCIKELQARKESLDAIALEELELQDNLELEEIELDRLRSRTSEFGIDTANNPLDSRELVILVRKRERKKKALETSLANLSKKQKEVEEEAMFFLKSLESLQKVEALKPYDDLEEQTKYWNEKLTQLANLKVLLHLPLDTELVQTILSLSDDCKIKTEVVKLLERERSLIEQHT